MYGIKAPTTVWRLACCSKLDTDANIVIVQSSRDILIMIHKHLPASFRPFEKYIKQQHNILHFVMGGLFHVRIRPTASSLVGVDGQLCSSSFGVLGVLVPVTFSCPDLSTPPALKAFCDLDGSESSSTSGSTPMSRKLWPLLC